MERRILLFFLMLSSYIMHGQVIINDTSTSASSAFSINATDKGVLIPKIHLPSVSTSTLDATNTAVDGLLIYNTNSTVLDGDGVGYYMFSMTNNKWEKVLTPKANVGLLPIGSILAWHNRVKYPWLTLPEGWQLCDGSLVTDTNSPLYGISTPNLNNNTVATSGDSSQGRFLRGSTISGQYQTDQTNNLSTVTSSTTPGGSTSLLLNENGGIGYLITDRVTQIFGNGDRYGFHLRGVENRVANMAVVWIMRIK